MKKTNPFVVRAGFWGFVEERKSLVDQSFHFRLEIVNGKGDMMYAFSILVYISTRSVL
jgi:hypothetical protein